jgi:glycosyltransferase involved in cell wall biosynthesis
MEPLISVIIPTYNRANTISRALNSVLHQTYSNIEIIIIDDGSSDNTEEILNNFKDNRIIIKKSMNRGAPAARNMGIRIAKGDFIAFLDSDDEWMLNKLEKQYNLISNSDTGFVYTGYHIIKPDGEIRLSRLPGKKGNIFTDLIISNCVGSTSLLFVKKQHLIDVGGFDESMPSCQDWDLFIRLSQICKADFVKEYLLKYYEDNSKVRIYNNPAKVILGHEKISQKYQNFIIKLPKDLQAAHFNYAALMLRSVGAIYESDENLFKAFLISLDFSYLVKILRFSLSHILKVALKR